MFHFLGRGDLLQVQLLLNEDCRVPPRSKLSGRGAGPLATAAAAVEVDFSASDIPHRPDFPQNDGGMAVPHTNTNFLDLHDILIGTIYFDITLGLQILISLFYFHLQYKFIFSLC